MDLHMMGKSKTNNNNISRTIYRSDLCLYAEQTGGHHLTAKIKHIPVELTGREI